MLRPTRHYNRACGGGILLKESSDAFTRSRNGTDVIPGCHRLTCVRQVCTVRSVQILSGKEQCGVELAGHLSSCCISVHMYNPAFLRALVMALVSDKALKLYHRFRASTGGRVLPTNQFTAIYCYNRHPRQHGSTSSRTLPSPVPQPNSQANFHSQAKFSFHSHFTCACLCFLRLRCLESGLESEPMW